MRNPTPGGYKQSERHPNHSGSCSVYQYFEDGSYEKVRAYVSELEAAKAFAHYTTSVGARLGMTKRVIITDGGDCIVAEWIYGKGVVFPKEAS